MGGRGDSCRFPVSFRLVCSSPTFNHGLHHLTRLGDYLTRESCSCADIPKLTELSRMPVDPHQYEPWMQYDTSGPKLSVNSLPKDEDLATVRFDEMPGFLQVHRDQSLWLACLTAVNPGGDVAAIANFHKWILSQPDCDNVLAVVAWGWWGGHRCCGLASDHVASIWDGLEVPAFIARRAKDQPFTTGALSDPWPEGTRSTLLARARSEEERLDPTAEPVARVPVEMLEHRPTGRTPRTGFGVDEAGLFVVRRLAN
jgi:hypothetical protein